MRHTAILNIYSNVTTINGMSDAKDNDGNPVILDESLISAELDRIQAKSNALAYSRKRKKEYPDFGTQLNKIYDDGLTKWKSEMVDPVKTKWPKDNSGPV